MIAKKLKIAGDVQGVSYRFWARKQAKNLGVSGWAKNDHDGSVTVVAQGEEKAVEELVEWAKEGSPMATVERLEVEMIEVDDNLKRFEVK